MLKCIIIDDEPLARSLMREMLEPLEMVQIVDECANGFEGLKSVQTHQPDLISWMCKCLRSMDLKCWN